MTFRSIVAKNLKYNFKRFLSYLFVNSFIVAVLFMYGSLLFNDILAKDAAMQLANSYINVAAYAIIIFSIVFVTYTGVYFVKSRGKEFGIYLTLGMTTKDLIRMIMFESFIIVIASAVCGILSGHLLSKLFYLILGKILNLTQQFYFISYKTYLLSLGVFALIFICNLIFTSMFIRKLSIVQITKASSTKGISKANPIIGCVSVIVFAISLWVFHSAITGNEALKGLMREFGSLALAVLMITIFVSLYFIISSCIAGVRLIVKRFPTLYNKNIILLSGLSHRFFAYKVCLYMVSLLIGLAIFFMGFGLTLYTFTAKTIEEYVPYDFMVETSGDINKTTQEELEKVVKDNGGTLENFSALEYITDVNYRNFADKFVNYRTVSMVISESNFNKHMGLSLDIAPDEMVVVYNQKGYAEQPIDYDSLITVENWRTGIDRADAFRETPTDMQTYLKSLSNVPKLEYKKEKTTGLYSNFINSYGNIEFAGVVANVVDDSVYNSLSATQHDTAFLFNLKSGDGKQIFEAILQTLRKANNADGTLWASPGTTYGAKDDVVVLRPIYKAERYEIAFRIGGFMLFALAFLGVLFLLSSCVVLYYKIVTDMEEEREQILLLKKIGLNSKECKSYLQKHLAIIFFAPLVVGGILGLFFVNSSTSFTVYSGYLMSRVLLMFLGFVVLDVLFYLSLRRKFLRGVGL